MVARAALKNALKELQAQERSIQKKIQALERALDAIGQQHDSLGRRLRRPMSAAERKSVSLRMKRYWDQRRRAAAKTSSRA